MKFEELLEKLQKEAQLNLHQYFKIIQNSQIYDLINSSSYQGLAITSKIFVGNLAHALLALDRYYLSQLKKFYRKEKLTLPTEEYLFLKYWSATSNEETIEGFLNYMQNKADLLLLEYVPTEKEMKFIDIELSGKCCLPSHYLINTTGLETKFFKEAYREENLIDNIPVGQLFWLIDVDYVWKEFINGCRGRSKDPKVEEKAEKIFGNLFRKEDTKDEEAQIRLAKSLKGIWKERCDEDACENQVKELKAKGIHVYSLIIYDSSW